MKIAKKDLNKWDLRFIGLAENMATWSKDPKTKVGAVVISPDLKRVSYGYNGFPGNIKDDERLTDERKNHFMMHAELNAIINSRTDLRHWAIYCTKFPCSHCALSIIQAGITKVVAYDIKNSGDWNENQRIALSMFEEAGIGVIRITED